MPRRVFPLLPPAAPPPGARAHRLIAVALAVLGTLTSLPTPAATAVAAAPAPAPATAPAPPATASPTAAAGGPTRFRYGFSSATFTAVNQNDARASIKIWGQVLFKERGLAVDSEPSIFKDITAIAGALRNNEVEAVALNTDEFWALPEELRDEHFVVGCNNDQITEEYVLVVAEGSGIQGPADLQGKSVLLLENSRMSLAPEWFDVLLADARLPLAQDFCKITPMAKISKAVLPVFFGQSQACIVSRRGYLAMGELNPQVPRRLKVIATSPPLVPCGFCFRRGFDDPIKQTILKELTRIQESVAGAQALTLFQAGSLRPEGLSCLATAFDLLERHARLRAATPVNSQP